MIENTNKKSKWEDRAFVALICWIVLFLVIAVSIAVIVINIRNGRGYDVQASETVDNSQEYSYVFSQLPSILVQYAEYTAVVGVLWFRALCLIAIILLQIIPVVIKGKKVKKAFTIVNCIFNLLIPIITVIPMFFIGTTSLITVLTVDIALSVGLMVYVAMWKCENE